MKQSELEAHPVHTNMKLLLSYLDQLCPFEPDRDPARPDYVRIFMDYVNTLSSVLVRSLSSEGAVSLPFFFFSFHISVCSKCSHPFTCLLDQSSEVKMGNPLLVLLQSPFQLLSHLHFDRQVSPDRYDSRLHPFSINYHTFVAVYFWNIFWVIVKYSGGQRPVTVE